MIDWARKKLYCWLVRYYGLDKVMRQYGIDDIEAYYDKLVHLLRVCRQQRKNCSLSDVLSEEIAGKFTDTMENENHITT